MRLVLFHHEIDDLLVGDGGFSPMHEGAHNVVDVGVNLKVRNLLQYIQQ